MVEAPWNIHRLDLGTLPIADISEPGLLRQIPIQFACSVTDREHSLRSAGDHTEALLNVKNVIHIIVSEFPSPRRARTFGLCTNDILDTIIFVTALRLDLASHGFVVDAQVLPLSEGMINNAKDALPAVCKELRLIHIHEEDMEAWKRLLPAFAERCRTWKHGQNCEYLAKRKVPLSLESAEDPLWSCGRGKDVTPEFRKEEAWGPAIPYVTRIAIGFLYGVPYAEKIGCCVPGEVKTKQPEPEPEPERRCQKCGGIGKPKLLVCSGCKGAGYCSADCQKEDWKVHKKTCRK